MKSKDELLHLTVSKRPHHVAIIMDRNGEWAKRRTMSRIMGHREGMKSVSRVVDAAAKHEIKVLSLFAFSTENWFRPEEEVSFLMRLLEEFIGSKGDELLSKDIKLVTSGRLDRLPDYAKNPIVKLVERSKDNQGMILNIALDYGGRAEMTYAAKAIANKVLVGELSVDDISEDTFSQHLHNPDLPDVDLMIRTGGELRISNFMLWQIAYSELIFIDTLWPDFSEADLVNALALYAKRKRRFGLTDDQIIDN